jgi:hypothetical protein
MMIINGTDIFYIWICAQIICFAKGDQAIVGDFCIVLEVYNSCNDCKQLLSKES